MKGKIGFDDLRIDCIIGDLPEERECEQAVYVDLRVVSDFSACAKTDHVNETIDYVALAELCRSLAVQNRYHLLETFAVEIIQLLLAREEIDSVWIRVKKPKGLPAAKFSVIELEQSK